MFPEYKDILFEYANLKENDGYTAYNLLKRASGIKEFWDQEIAKYNKIYNQLERQAKGIEARVSCELSKQGVKSVSDANRRAIFDNEVESAWNDAFEAKRVRDTYKAYADNCERIYYDCKDVWLKGIKTFRQNREGE